MRMYFVSALLIAQSIVMIGCNHRVDIRNGELPSDLIPFAEQFVGNYSGDFNGQPANLSLELQGNKLIANTSRDFLGRDCLSSIKDLESVSIKRKKKVNKALVQASFALNKGRCNSEIDGQYLHLSFDSKKHKIRAEIVKNSDCIDICTTTSGSDGYSSIVCAPECSVDYLWGSFKKTE